MKALCPFLRTYEEAVGKAFPGMQVVIGTHQEHITPEEFRKRVARLFRQDRKTMVDLILNKD